MAEKRIVLGFVGLPCAGKGTAIDYLVKNKNFFFSSISDELREYLRSQNLEITRENLQNTGGQMREKYGPEVWVKKTWDRVFNCGNVKAVVDSIRAIPEVEFLKKQPGFYLIAVLTDPKTRFERMKQRNREGDPRTWEDFVVMEEKDKTGGGRNIDACLAMADFTVENSGTIDKVNEQLENILTKLN